MKLKIVGIGPGKVEEMTIRAFRALDEAELVVGYDLYNSLLVESFPDKEYFSTPMRGEIERCRYALKRAEEGVNVVLVCSGDSGIYGMAALAEEVLAEMEDKGEISHIDIEVIPGVTAAISAGALAGAPLTCDFAVISLSDLLTPWSVIEKRLEGAAAGDLVIALYNPGSKKRKANLSKACEIIMRYRKPSTICSVVSDVARADESVVYMTLSELFWIDADMHMTIFIGNSQSSLVNGRMITSRGYLEKYCSDSDIKVRIKSLPEKMKILKESPGILARDLPLYKKKSKEGALLIFGGTTEGRQLAEVAAEEGYDVMLCVANNYGKEVISPHKGLYVSVGKLDEADMQQLMKVYNWMAVIDATHPYASKVTSNIRAASERLGLEYVRIRRDIDELFDLAEDKKVVSLPDMDALVEYLDKSDERVFIASGSNAAEKYAKIKDASERLTIRIIPSEEALKKCREAGFTGKNIIAMQGPFSEEVNEAMFWTTGARTLVTKASGKEGGFDEKIAAAKKLDMKIIIIQPPADVDGVTLEEAEAWIKKL